MGLCISCIYGNTNEEEDDETTSLLGRRHQNQSTECLQQEEILKQQKRHQELTAIVNDLSDKLIDVTSFLNDSTGSKSISSPSLTQQTQIGATYTNGSVSIHGSTGNLNMSEMLGDESQLKQYLHVYNTSERDLVIEKTAKLDDSIRQACRVTVSEPLYLIF
ncbi:hypothetical protein KGF56_004827 [Candida oxycetoniae]|uniref:Uncharacterized protein n=1 Tax=Candida oxycetoniae TaxID=497107 RepID=A0AAI9WVL5_9ASCO|nr:uncharacterized protein KGF56_004827 [Candida oxycetoniae]KAI3402419.2 hypothetical protein KGF56_004827 [Candida oxycetoniae]